MAGFGDLNIVTFLKSKMKWHQARQKVLSENVANADTPGYRPSDLKPLTFKAALEASGKQSNLSLDRTHKDHLSSSGLGFGSFATDKSKDFEMTPEGNGVVLEDQMMKVSENAFDYQLASNIYTRSLGLIRTAIGRNS